MGKGAWHVKKSCIDWTFRKVIPQNSILFLNIEIGRLKNGDLKKVISCDVKKPLKFTNYASNIFSNIFVIFS